MGKKYSDCHRVSENILLFKEDFGEFAVEVVSDLLAYVDIWLTDALGVPHFSSKQVVIIHGDDEPMCSNYKGAHLVRLVTHNNYWCQWVFQFAHEYCHHLIDGGLTGDVDGLVWFEETICELSSMYCLGKMMSFCWHHTNQNLKHYHPSVRDYLDDRLRGGLAQGPLHLYIRRNLPLLEQPEYHREIYRSVAMQMLPLFVECPDLWKIILHFGNMSEWNSLTLLFDHLKEEADTTYADALQRLRVLLLGS